MEVIDENAAKLSNYEVFALLKDIQNGTNDQKKPSKHQQHLATISYSTLKYLEKTPCGDQSPDILSKFMKSLGPFKLTKAEKLLLLNHRPTSAVEIQLIIEESEERLTEEQIEQLLNIVATCLPGDEPPPPEGSEEGMDAEEQQ